MNNTFDYLFVGAGASTTLLLMSMEKRGLLKNKSIAIIDPDDKSKNDKTYCFWAKQEDPIYKDCNRLISYKWDKIIVHNSREESIEPLQYLHIKGEDVYTELKRIILEHQIHRIHDAVKLIIQNDNTLHVITQDQKIKYQSQVVFDSRPPIYQNTASNQYQLSQSFIGYVIETENPIPMHDCVRLMDFEVDQQNHTQFMYVLPFESNKALVEITRFGSERISQQEAEDILNNYIPENLGNYKISNIEKGCIPMSNADIIKEEIANVIPIGARAGAIKASTGYAFKKMFDHAEQISTSLQQNDLNIKIDSKTKFKFYDRLLLQILNSQSHYGKQIFQTLFQKNKAIDVLNFIDEKTSLNQDIKILLSLPLKPFLKALFFDTLHKVKAYANPLLLLMFTLLLIGLKWESHTVFNLSQILFLSLGLLLVGIPHGALDNIVENGNINAKFSFTFILKYLGIGFIYFVLWLILPNIALLFFLLYSAWHFGQSDMKDWNPKNNGILNFAWGAILLGIILLGHLKETNEIVSSMGAITIPLSYYSANVMMGLLSFIAISWAVYHGKTAMLLVSITLLMSSFLPLFTSFGIYFIGQHSITGWKHLKTSLKSDNISLFKKAIPFNIGALLLFALMLFNINNTWISSFFILISCISLPHVYVMNNFYSNFFHLRAS